MKFRVLESSHEHTDGKTYVKGDVIESADDLRTHFANKFKLVGEKTQTTKHDRFVSQTTNPRDPTLSKRVSVAESEEDTEEDSVVTDDDESDDASADEEETDLSDDDKDNDGKSDADPTKPPGKDLTVEFKDAVDQDYKVFKNRGQYFIYDGDDLTKPKNDKGLAKKEVGKAIKKAVKASST